MIVGIGSDLANITRIEESIETFGDRFINRIFSDYEKMEMEKRKKVSPRRYASSVAKRFAVKEACSKALGTGLRRGTFWRDMEVVHLPSGKPIIRLSGGALEHAKKLTEGGEMVINVTMTDDYPWAQAFVMIEKI
ncbi:MAG: holo-ACP synthase [Lactobacillaceae bacterium]|jgi:holo-[acyl-carrier protein] synthase|nr:holo-ACP synthase [Lactobacillaceae bacterium]